MKKPPINTKQGLEADRRRIDLWDWSYDLSHTENLWGADHIPFIVRVLDLIAPAQRDIVLDLPCGDGRNSVPLASACSLIVAADSSRRALALTNHRLVSTDIRNYSLLQADVFATPFTDSTFGAVFCCDLLGHLHTVDRALSELRRICRPNGVIVGTIFSLGDSTRSLDMEQIGHNEYIYNGKFFYKFYSELEVTHLLIPLECKLLALELVQWREQPHQGFREYEHEHESWLFALLKSPSK